MRTEQADISSEFAKLSGATALESCDGAQLMVTISFTVKKLARIALRLEAMKGKTSDKFNRETRGVFESIDALVKEKTDEFLRAMFRAVVGALKSGPLDVATNAFSAGDVTKAKQNGALDKLHNRAFQQMSTLPAKSSFSNLLDKRCFHCCRWHNVQKPPSRKSSLSRRQQVTLIALLRSSGLTCIT